MLDTRIMNEVEEIKSKIDIVDFVGQYLTLKKAGTNYKANCPFHEEHSPSFMVSPEKQIYKCFGCNEGGDVINFLMKMENLEFPEALEILADKVGVKLNKHISSEIYKKEKNIKVRLYKINELSKKVFYKILLEHKTGKIALEYLQKRKITLETIKKFQIGYIPSNRVLNNFLLDRGFSEQEIRDAGAPNRFFNRIMFPINDIGGNTVAFTGRTIEKRVEPKYLNTSETMIFHKGQILFGLDLAKKYIKENNNTIVVEGQMDVISSFQANVKNVVASSGTALTKDHLKILARYSGNVSFCFDQDSAGKRAAKKAIELAIVAGMNPKIILLPKKYKDAGEVIEDGEMSWEEIVKNKQGAIDWMIDQAFLGKNELSGVDKKMIAKEILPIISIIPDKIEQGHYVKTLSRKLNTVEKIIFEALQKSEEQIDTKQEKVAVKSNTITLNENFIALLILYPKSWEKVISKVDYKDFQEELPKKVYKFIQSCYTMNECKTRERCETRDKVLLCLEKILSYDETKKVKFLLLEIETRYKNVEIDKVLFDIEDMSSRIIKERQEKIKVNFANEISLAEQNGDRKKVKKLLEELQHAIKEKK